MIRLVVRAVRHTGFTFMNTPHSLLLHDRAATAEWCTSRSVRLCVAFGSRARGAARPDSDLDLAISTDAAPSPEVLLAWRRELEELLGVAVHLVVMGSDIDPVLAFEIARDGMVLHESADGEWMHQRLRLWHTYQDALPFLRAARKQLRDFADEVRRGT